MPLCLLGAGARFSLPTTVTVWLRFHYFPLFLFLAHVFLLTKPAYRSWLTASLTGAARSGAAAQPVRETVSCPTSPHTLPLPGHSRCPAQRKPVPAESGRSVPHLCHRADRASPSPCPQLRRRRPVALTSVPSRRERWGRERFPPGPVPPPPPPPPGRAPHCRPGAGSVWSQPWSLKPGFESG